MMVSAFLPGALNSTFNAADIVPNQPITLTRVTAREKTASTFCATRPVIRVSDGTSGQDLPLSDGMTDSGPLAVKFAANSDVQVKVQVAASCSPVPADTNVVLQYKVTESTDVTTCAQGGQICNGICETTVTDPQNCGACGNVCSGSTPNCLDSECGPICLPNTADCDHVASNGCEVDITSSAQNCGACGNVCSAQGPNATGAVCQSSQCVNTCTAGFGDCDGNATNGCETPTSADLNNCGGCNIQCTFPGDVCANGLCTNNLPSGSFCNQNSECASGQCVESCNQLFCIKQCM
jgi:hypothetical protein